MSKRPYFQFYPADDLLLDSACRRMSLEALGAHMKLYCLAWLEHGLPANPAELSRELGISLRRFSSLWKEISPAWEEADGRIYCQRQEQKRQEYEDFVEKQRTNGRKGGRPRITQSEPKISQAFILGDPKESLSPSSSSSFPREPPPPPEAAAIPSQAVGETSAGGGGQLVALQEVRDQPGSGPDRRDSPELSARIETIAQRRVAEGKARGGLGGSRKWCWENYRGEGEVFREIHGGQAAANGAGRELLGVTLPEHLTPDAVAKIRRWVEQRPQEAAEILSDVRESQDAHNDPNRIPGLFAARLGDRMRAQAIADQEATGLAPV